LQSKLLSLEDGGYGDFDYEDADLNFFLSMSCARMYPAAYQKLPQLALTLTEYGTQGLASCTPTYPDRVFLVEDSVERQPLSGWRTSGSDIINLDPNSGAGSAVVSTVNVYYHDAYTISNELGDSPDRIDCGIPASFEPLINLGALIEALEARQDTGVRGDPAPIGQFHEVTLLDRLNTRYEKLKSELAMSLPGIAF
jgi:hypothetical protein